MKDPTAQKHKQDTGWRLGVAIDAVGETQAEIARKFDVSPSRLNNWLNGDNYPDEWFVFRFCSRYPITADWIYRGEVSSLGKGDVADSLFSAKQASLEVPAEAQPLAGGDGRKKKTSSRARG